GAHRLFLGLALPRKSPRRFAYAATPWLGRQAGTKALLSTAQNHVIRIAAQELHGGLGVRVAWVEGGMCNEVAQPRTRLVNSHAPVSMPREPILALRVSGDGSTRVRCIR